jgi:hypothetical protein
VKYRSTQFASGITAAKTPKIISVAAVTCSGVSCIQRTPKAVPNGTRRPSALAITVLDVKKFL